MDEILEEFQWIVTEFQGIPRQFPDPGISRAVSGNFREISWIPREIPRDPGISRDPGILEFPGSRNFQGMSMGNSGKFHGIPGKF